MMGKTKTFLYNYNRLKEAKEKMIMEIRSYWIEYLFDSIKRIQKGDYNKEAIRLMLDCEGLPEQRKKFIYSTIDFYLKAFSATIPSNFKKDRLSEMEKNRKALDELVQSFSFKEESKISGASGGCGG